MRIAHVVSTFPPHIGGMGAVTFEEAKGLQARGHEVTVCTLRYPHTTYDDHSFPFKVNRFQPLLRLGDGGWVPGLTTALKDFDILHLHYPFYGGAEWVRRAAHRYKKPYVVTYHMDAAPTGIIKPFIKNFYDRLVAWKVLRQAKAVIGVDREHFLNTEFGKRLLNFQRCVEIKLGVDTELFKPQSPSLDSSKLPSGVQGKKIILFVGNLIPFKRLDLLLETFKNISYSEPDAVLMVVGGGYESKHYQHLAEELGIGKRVFFTGPCTDKNQLVAYYNAATALVMPSDQGESFSLVVSEAMASGTTVIVSDIPGLKGRVEDRKDGFVFHSQDTEDLARVLVEVLHLSLEERKSIGENARKKMIAHFSWKKHVDELEELYKNILQA